MGWSLPHVLLFMKKEDFQNFFAFSVLYISMLQYLELWLLDVPGTVKSLKKGHHREARILTSVQR